MSKSNCTTYTVTIPLTSDEGLDPSTVLDAALEAGARLAGELGADVDEDQVAVVVADNAEGGAA